MGGRARAVLAAALVFAIVLLGAQSHTTTTLFDDGAMRVDLDARIEIAPNTTWLDASGDWIRVRVAGVPNPNNDDWIGVFTSPPGAPPRLASAPVKYKFANASDEYLGEGRGTYRFSLVNPRADLVLALLRNGLGAPIVAAVSGPVRFRARAEPQAPHWSIGPGAGTFRLSWVSTAVDDAVVQWGATPDRLDRVAYPDAARFTRDQMCGPPAATVGWYDPGTVYHALVGDLAPGTDVYYRFGSVTAGLSAVRRFRTPPGPGRRVRLVAYGDMGSGMVDGARAALPAEPASLATSALLARADDDADLVLHIGDISYAKGYLSQWDYFLWQIAPIAAAVPYQTAIGNHESDYPGSGARFNGTDSGGECGVPYALYFPTPDGVSRSRPWYSFDAGAVHVAVLSGEDDFGPGSAQFAFLARDLAAVDRARTPWVVVAGHRPMYCDSTWVQGPSSDGQVAADLRAALEALLYDGGVDLALWGHNHSYQRTCAVVNGTCVEGKAPVHIVVGTAGFSLSKDGAATPPAWLRARIDTFGVGRLTATPSQLRFEFVRSDDGTVSDVVVLDRVQIESL